MNGTTTSNSHNRKSDPLPHRAGPWGIGRLSARLAQARFDRRRLGGRGGPADGDRVRPNHRARPGRRTLRCHPGTVGLRPVRHVPPLDRESGRGHLRDDRSDADAPCCRRSGSPALAIRRLGHLHRSVLLCRQLAPARFSRRLPFPADSDRLSQWRGHQHLPGPDRQGVRLPDEVARHHSQPSSSSSARCPKRTCRRWR